MAVNELEELQGRIRAFVRERDWEQFHSPKNLAMALIVEAGELVEQLQWLTEDESCNLTPEKLQAVEEEVADIFVYLLRITDRLDIDLLAATRDKMNSNAAKYPVDRVRGSSRKYTDYR
jgi:NTP pyrophosphatase (non-canonical NTP hydrolase)